MLSTIIIIIPVSVSESTESPVSTIFSSHKVNVPVQRCEAGGGGVGVGGWRSSLIS